MGRVRNLRLFRIGQSLIVLLTILLLVRGLSVLYTEKNGTSLSLYLKNTVVTQTVKTYLPLLCYSENQQDADGGIAALVTLCELQWQPLAAYAEAGTTDGYTAESALSAAMIASAQGGEEAAPADTADDNTDAQEAEAASGKADEAATDAPAESQTAENQTTETAAQTAATGSILRHGDAIGTVYTAAQLTDFTYLLNNFFTLDSTTTIDETLLDGSVLLSKDFTLTQEADTPQILIYHTHSQEAFADSTEGDASTSIVAVGDYLASLLTDVYGYTVIHDTTAYDLVDGQLDRNKAYTQALSGVSAILEEHPTIQVVIDLHRDGISGEKQTVTINGKETATLMFFNGLSRTVKNGAIESLCNPYIQDNLAFSLQLKLTAELYYPGVTRPIYLKGYRYNLHLRPCCLLVEAGSQKNTLAEELNAMEVLADVLDLVLRGESSLHGS